MQINVVLSRRDRGGGGERGGETGDEQGKGTGGGRGEENRMWVCRGDSWEEAGVNIYMKENVESQNTEAETSTGLKPVQWAVGLALK